MSFEPGSQVGHYEILASIGAGGMGEVYRARDTKLGREVAIKVLPEAFSGDKERLARFEREARLLASLNHPNIATLFDLQEFDGVHFLVLELVPGETLAEQIKRGAIPVDEALPLFKQIAEGLEEAHENGVIHRDLKPANIKVTPEGKVKVLDFGLAKALATEEPVEDSSQSPTLTKGTALGAIMGTAAYMSPEQARGKPVDRRTDIWAFGCCLYEALTGRKAFSGETVTDTLAAIVKNEPDWKALPGGSPIKIRELLRRCLQKDKSQRLHDVADARIEIDEAIDEPDIEPGEEAGTKKSTIIIRSALVGVLLGTFFGAWLWGRLAPRSVDVAPAALVTRSVIELATEAPLSLGGEVPQLGYESPVIALSPDGKTLVYVGSSEEGRQLYLRALDGFEVTPISGTEGAIFPFFSPDRRWLGFLTDNQVKKVSLQGGAPVTLSDANIPGRANWTRDDWIYFTESESSALARVPATGGQPSSVVTLSAGHKISEVLPSGRAALVTSRVQGGVGYDYGNILLLSLETQETKVLIRPGYDPRYVPSGHLLFTRSGNLLAVPFDLERLEVHGEPVPVVSTVGTHSFFGQTQVTISENGLLAYVPGHDSARGKLAWVDRQGQTEFLPVPERLYGSVDLATGGERLAVHVADVKDYVWIYDIPRGEGRKLATSRAAGWPLWMPDSKRISFVSTQPGEAWRIFSQEMEQPESAEELLSLSGYSAVTSWSPDGNVVAFSVFAGAQRGMGFLSVGTGQQPEYLAGKNSNQWHTTFAPDGQWIAYTSDETGRSEIWVRSYPAGDRIQQISVDGGREPRWLWESGELFYRRGNQWFSTRISLHPELSWEPPRLAFETDFIDTPGRSYDVSPDGQRLLVVKRTREPTRTKIHIVHNWFQELKRLVPTEND